MNSKVFADFKFLFKVFAFEPLKSKTFTYLWIGFHIFSFVIQFFVIWTFRHVVLYTYDPIGKASDYIKLFSTFCSYASAIFVSLRQEKSHEKILNQEENLEILMEKFYVNADAVKKKFHKSFKKKFVLLFSFQIYGSVQELVLKQGETQTVRFIVAFLFPAVFCVLKLLHTIFYIELNKYHFDVLNDQLLHVKDLLKINEKSLKDSKYNRFLFKRLKFCRDFYRMLVNINESDNECMGFFYLVNQVNLYIHTLSSLYWMTFRTINQHFDPMICKYFHFLILLSLN